MGALPRLKIKDELHYRAVEVDGHRIELCPDCLRRYLRL